MKINKAVIYIQGQNQQQNETQAARLEKHMSSLCHANIANVLIVNDSTLPNYPDEELFENMTVYHLKMEQPVSLKKALSRCQGFIGEEPFLLIRNEVELETLTPQIYNRMMNDYYAKRHSMLMYQTAESRNGFAAANIAIEQEDYPLIKSIDQTKSNAEHVSLVGIDILRPEIFDYLQDKSLQSEGFYGALNQMCQDQKVYGLNINGMCQA